MSTEHPGAAVSAKMLTKGVPATPATTPAARTDGGNGASGRADRPLRPVGDTPPSRRLVAVPASSVRSRRVRWAWDNRVPVGGLTLLAGREGLGKSTLAVELAARVTRGELAGEHHGTPRHVIYVSTEDSREYTIKNRLVAAGADLDRVLFLDAYAPGAVDPSPPVLPSDVDRLAEIITSNGAALVILDAATSVMDGRLEGNSDRDMRRALEPLSALADRTGCAVLGLAHFGKRESSDVGKLILGTVAWSQVARSVLGLALDPTVGDLVLSNGKGNLAPAGTPSLAFTIATTTVMTDENEATTVGRIMWSGETDRRVGDLLGSRDSDREDQDDTSAWLLGYLAEKGCAASARDVVAAARAEGIAERTLQRARRRAGVTSTRTGYQGGSVWSYDPTTTTTAIHASPARGGTAGTTDTDPTDHPNGDTP